MEETKTDGKKILHIEDDRNVFMLVKMILEKTGHKVISAVDAMQGMMLARQHQPDLLILDIMMPAGGGLSVLERIRTLSTTLHIPILVYTATPIEELKAIAFGADCVYLQKPAQPDQIRRAVDALLGGGA